MWIQHAASPLLVNCPNRAQVGKHIVAPTLFLRIFRSSPCTVDAQFLIQRRVPGRGLLTKIYCPVLFIARLYTNIVSGRFSNIQNGGNDSPQSRKVIYLTGTEINHTSTCSTPRGPFGEQPLAQLRQRRSNNTQVERSPWGHSEVSVA